MRERAEGRPNVAEQLRIEEFTSAAAAIDYLFPESNGVLSSVLSLENLTPNPLQKGNPFLFIRIFPEGVKMVAYSSALVDITAESNVYQEQETIEKRRIKKAKGIIVWFDEENKVFLEQFINQISPNLKINTGVWILEKTTDRLTEVEKEERVKKLAAWELVNRKVVQKKASTFDYCWYSRTERPAKHTREFDLTADGRFPRRLWEMKKKYLSEGWKKIDSAELEEACRHSKMPFLEGSPYLECLDLGFGVRLEAPCGCGWHVCLNGDWERDFSQKCGDEDCDGLPKEIKLLGEEEKAKYLQLGKEKPKGRIILIGYNIPSHLVGSEMHCYGCRAEMMVDRVRQSETEILSDLKCPHCGEWRSASNPRIIKLGKGDEVKEYTTSVQSLK